MAITWKGSNQHYLIQSRETLKQCDPTEEKQPSSKRKGSHTRSLSLFQVRGLAWTVLVSAVARDVTLCALIALYLLGFSFSSLCLYPSQVSYFLLVFKLDLSTLRINMSLTPVSQVSMTAHVSCSALLNDHLTSAQILVMTAATDGAGICVRKCPQI